MGGRERLALDASLVLPVIPCVASLARIREVWSGAGVDPALVPPFWPVPLFTRVAVAAVVALMCAGPGWRWAEADPEGVAAFVPRVLWLVSAVVLLQIAVAP